MTDEGIVIDPPLRGEWAVLNPPGHHRLACDFLATRGNKWPYRGKDFLKHLFLSIPVEATYTWQQPVYAPLDGEVVACSGDAPDRERISMVRDLFSLLLFPPRPGSPFSAYGGNHIILKCGGVFPLLAHLRRGSLRVKTGDRVKAGDHLADVGNSGSSIQPHLHFQVMENQDPFPLFENLVPFRLRTAKKRINGRWQDAGKAAVGKGDHLLL